MKRTLVGLLFLVHGLAHSAIGTWASAYGPAWLVTPLWLAAEVGFIAAGLGVLGVPWGRRIWEPSALVAALSSVLLFDLFGHVALAWGLLVDTVVLVAGLRWGESALIASKAVGIPIADRPRRHPIVATLGAAFVIYVALVIALRPWSMRWGTSETDRAARLPGDDRLRVANYRMDHAITIHASADSVWPWLVQIGQDRAGFYSYDWLERLIGDRIRNADRVHPEWQVRQAGDLIRSAQPDYMRGAFGRELGWRVAEVIPGEAIVFEGWGAFVIRPLDAHTSRLQIRVRSEGTPSIARTVVSPFTLLVYEPAHFIMERGMLRGIKARAERRT